MYWENEMQELLETQDPDNEEKYDGLVSEYEKVFAWTHQNKNDRCESATDSQPPSILYGSVYSCSSLYIAARVYI